MQNAPNTGKNIVIIGAGIIGISTAVWLQRDGHNVTIIDPLPPGEATSHGNGGVLASVGVVPVTVPGLLRKAPAMLLNPNSPLFMRWGYFPKLLPWLVKYLGHANDKSVDDISKALTFLLNDSYDQHSQLAAGTGAEKYLHADDYFFAYESREAFLKDAYGWQVRKKRGYDWDELTAQEFHAFDPSYGGTVGHAIRLRNHGRISNPGDYVKTLAAHVEKKGGRFVRDKAVDFKFEAVADSDSRIVSSVICETQTVECDDLVLATGAWSKSLAAKLNIHIDLETERGYHIEFMDPSFMPKAPAMMASGKFVITPMEGRIRCAGIVEFGGLKRTAQQTPFELLQKQAESALPNLRYSKIERWMGHRPAPASSIPLIGVPKYLPNTHLTLGHHHIGLTGAAKTGRLVSGFVRGEKTNVDLEMFKP